MYKCPECGKELPTRQGLSGHLRFKHGKLVSGARSKPVASLAEQMLQVMFKKPLEVKNPKTGEVIGTLSLKE